ncbi:helix-turn-helix domain-containing protein [Aliikangiella coralliicola]|uniref:Helix-turn-helix transcriptional regulator n=1 Tax=Aliikangiella coralliicola TaxID=2592383 RepID=A0A545UD13_9GAMM|nr:helix-turn-helix transcriptional regulator [Aliikangiella coralliicola]
MKQHELRKRLAKFLKLKRGTTPLRNFAKQHGMSFASVSRIEKLEQNVTLDTLEHMCKAFKCDIEDLFPK